MRPKKKSEVASKELADNEGVEGENVDEEDKDVYDVNNGRGKRKRRESKSYEPDDFTMSSYNAAVKASAIAVGRGKKLGEIAAVKSSINMYKLNTEELLLAYKFVFFEPRYSQEEINERKVVGIQRLSSSDPQREIRRRETRRRR
mmetsp:Transcript_14342/g.29941  ORF Transcript_14342/g.29941 Transcript_14342/m.29941 type:complete len:145 (+) Transcript_14342:60-494(+)